MLNALNWAGAGLTEPTYHRGYLAEDRVLSNYCIIRELGITPVRQSTTTYQLQHQVQITLDATTKAKAFGNLKFVLKSLLFYQDDQFAVDPESFDVNVSYDLKHKSFEISFTLQEECAK